MVASSGQQNVPGECDENSATRQPPTADWRLAQMSANLTVQMMNLSTNAFELVVIVRFERRAALVLQLAHLRLDRRLVDPGRLVVPVRLDAERLAQSRQQVLLVHLRVALHR